MMAPALAWLIVIMGVVSTAALAMGGIGLAAANGWLFIVANWFVGVTQRPARALTYVFGRVERWAWPWAVATFAAFVVQAVLRGKANPLSVFTWGLIAFQYARAVRGCRDRGRDQQAQEIGALSLRWRQGMDRLGLYLVFVAGITVFAPSWQASARAFAFGVASAFPLGALLDAPGGDRTLAGDVRRGLASLRERLAPSPGGLVPA